VAESTEALNPLYTSPECKTEEKAVKDHHWDSPKRIYGMLDILKPTYKYTRNGFIDR
jgi:hypothetical protein